MSVLDTIASSYQTSPYFPYMIAPLNDIGYTALHFAAQASITSNYQANCFPLVEILVLIYGVSPSILNNKLQTPLFYATDKEVRDFLLRWAD